MNCITNFIALYNGLGTILQVTEAVTDFCSFSWRPKNAEYHKLCQCQSTWTLKTAFHRVRSWESPNILASANYSGLPWLSRVSSYGSFNHLSPEKSLKLCALLWSHGTSPKTHEILLIVSVSSFLSELGKGLGSIRQSFVLICEHNREYTVDKKTLFCVWLIMN